ncbi:hypothetical protein [Chryseobacterium sp. MP_3.2]|uniref:hypothetical protein n=1 Tax=Chryseobacterium sp. MP_3.2 TaxID=3071712 RepID=UPI002E06E093|nr:hypothetical protein [Chryseobacterium sp. MP_3.2]
MAKLITTKEVLYDNRSNKSAKMMFEMIVGNKQGDNYNITVNDYIVTEVGESKSFQFWSKKDLQIPVTQINSLFDAVSALIPSETPYSEKEDLAHTYAFLYFVQNDIIESTGKCIYGLDPEDFIIYSE